MQIVGIPRAFSFSEFRSNAEQEKGFRDVSGVAAQGGGNVGIASPAHQGGGQVAKGCQHLRSVTAPYLGAVFVKAGLCAFLEK